MNPERWRQIEEVFQTVIERPPDERKSLLTQHCGGDDELRREVESLLGHEGADAFIQGPIRGAATNQSSNSAKTSAVIWEACRSSRAPTHFVTAPANSFAATASPSLR